MTQANPLHAWRTAQNYSPAKAAETVGVKRQTWWRWENGHSRVAFDKLEAVEAETGISRRVLRPDIFEGV